jgi:hypothetical protein
VFFVVEGLGCRFRGRDQIGEETEKLGEVRGDVGGGVGVGDCVATLAKRFGLS